MKKTPEPTEVTKFYSPEVAKLRDLLADVANSFLQEGCDRCGTIDVATINRVRQELGWQLLDDEDFDDEDIDGDI